nr:hypothetical protein [Tanacetum cinerariifolium]
MNANELLKMDPYEEVAQQRQVPPLSPAYMPDPMELNEHVPLYILEPEYPDYQAPSDDDTQCNTPKLGRSGIMIWGVLLIRSIT